MKLCISLDLPTADENLALAQEVKAFDVWLKVGFRTYIRDGKAFLENLKAINPHFKIFLDLKLYDIPNTMADAAEEIARFGLVDMFNVHASAGKRAMREVMQRIENIPNKPLVLAVTALTSFDEDEFKAIYNEDIQTKATKIAQESFESGLDGVVCSPLESGKVHEVCGSGFLTVTPGVRFADGDKQRERQLRGGGCPRSDDGERG